MTFHFAGAGAPGDVVRQIRSHHVEGGPGHDLRELICSMLEQSDHGDYVYAVEATGHSGPGGAASLEVKLRAIYAPAAWRDRAIVEIPLPELVDEPVLVIPGAMTAAAAVQMLSEIDGGKLADAAAALAKANPDLFKQVAGAAAAQLSETVNGHELGIGIDPLDAQAVADHYAQAAELADEAVEVPTREHYLAAEHALVSDPDDL